MKRILNYFNPNNPPKSLKGADDITIWREKILQSILLIASGLGLTGFIIGYLNGMTIIQARNVFYAFSIAVAGLVITATFRIIPFKTRASILPLLPFAAGIFATTQVGLSANAGIFLIASALLATIVMGLGTGIIYLVGEIALIIGYGTMVNLKMLPVPGGNILSDPSQPISWIMWAVFLLLISSMLLFSINQLVNGLGKSITQQKALIYTVEREREVLREEVKKQTEDLERRLSQLRTVAEISSEISKTLEIEDLLRKVIDLVRINFGLYYVGVFLIDEVGEYAVLRSGTGDEGKQMLARNHKLAVNGPSMIGWATGKKEPRIALDVGAEAVHFNNPFLPYTRSEMALPIIGKNDHVIGAMTIQSYKHNAFDNDDVIILNNISNALAVAIENAELFQKSQKDLEEIEMLNKAFIQKAWSETILQSGDMTYVYESEQNSIKSKSFENLTVPLLIRDQKIGEIEMDLDMENLSEEDTNFIQAISAQTALALEGARLLEQSQRQALQEQKINELSAEFAKAIRVDEILKIALQELANLPLVSEVSIHIQGEDNSYISPNGNGYGNGNGNGNGREQVN